MLTFERIDAYCVSRDPKKREAQKGARMNGKKQDVEEQDEFLLRSPDGGIQKKEPADAGNTPMDLVRIAVTSGADVDKLEKLMDLQQRWQAEQARRSFFNSMNAVQSEIEPIRKDAINSFTKTRYAQLETIHKALCPIYTKAGFSLSFSEGDAKRDGDVRVSAMVMHRDGHCQEYHADLALDAAGARGGANKTDVQAKGSTFSYGRRYLEMLIFNLCLVNEDDDGVGRSTAAITEDQAMNLRELCEASGRRVETLCQLAGVADLAHYPAAAYDAAAKMLADAANKRK